MLTDCGRSASCASVRVAPRVVLPMNPTSYSTSPETCTASSTETIGTLGLVPLSGLR